MKTETKWCYGWAVIGVFFCSTAFAKAPETLKDSKFLTSSGAAWKLAWSDEFDGDALDAAKWSIGLSWKGDDGTNRHHNSQYASYIADDCIEVAGGELRLYTRRGPFRNGGKTYDYSEGLIQTDGKYAGKYGYYEVRARIPAEKGPGMWPAFWMLPKGWPPEMDILEVWTSSNRNHQGLAYRKENGQVGWDDINDNAPLPTGYHTFGMEWGPGYQVYNIDGRINKIVSGNYVPAEPMYILLNSGIESGWQPNEATEFPNVFAVDYVRVYQRSECPVVVNGGFDYPQREPWTLTGRALRTGYQWHSKPNALRLDDTKASASQTVYGLKPNTRYVVNGYLCVTGEGDEARLGVKDFGGAAVSASTRSRKYERVSVSFTTGSDATSAVISCEKPSGTGSAFFDTISIGMG